MGYSQIKRGDRKDTGDLEARPQQKGASPDLKDGTVQDLQGLTIHDAEDPELGLTNIGEVPAQDWAADTGETKNRDMEKEPDDVHPARRKQEESD